MFQALVLSLADTSNDGTANDGTATSTKVAKARKGNHSTANNQKSKTIKKVTVEVSFNKLKYLGICLYVCGSQGRRTNFSCEDIAAIFSIFDGMFSMLQCLYFLFAIFLVISKNLGML